VLSEISDHLRGAWRANYRRTVSEPVPAGELAHSLTPEEYGEPVRCAGRPVPVLAWIRNRDGHRVVDGVVTAWTPRAVEVRYTDDRGRVGSVWLWSSAVLRLPAKPDHGEM
jgi:hypothetical protein